jgi:hypothetical protein
MIFSFSGEINNVEEFMQFQRILHKELFGKMFSRKNICFIILLMLIYFIQDLKKEYSLQKIIIYIMVIGIPCILVLLAAYSKVLNKNSFIKYKSKIGQFNFTINENTINIDCKYGIANLDKSNIRKIIFDNDSIYIIPVSTFGGIIKKRYFEDEGIYNELVLFLKKYFTEKI